MDEPSWRLLELIKDECSKIAIIMLVLTDTNNNTKIHPEARQFFMETFVQSASPITIIDLPPFKVDDLATLISDVSSKYQNSMGEEIHLMTFIEDPATSIKKPEVCK
jgi:predicted ATPase